MPRVRRDPVTFDEADDCPVARILGEAIMVAHDPAQVPDIEVAIASLLPVLLAAGWWEMAIHLAWPEQFLPFAPFHHEALAWWSEIVPGVEPEPLVAAWPRATGKALALDTPLPTPEGWTTMGAVQPGDYVLDHAGQPTRVVAKTPPHERPGYRVVFDDGAELIASDNHEWTVLTRQTLFQMRKEGYNIDDRWPDWQAAMKPRGNGGRPSAPETITTVEMGARAVSGRVGQRERLLAIPLARTGGGAAVLPIDPYWLGYWLGDGTSANSNITVGTEDVDWVAAELGGCEYPPRLMRRDGSGWRLIFSLGAADRGARCPRGHATEPDKRYCYTCDYGDGMSDPALRLQDRLRALDLIDNKHIPDIYLRASRGQRLALLAGLLDSDGSADARQGAIEFSVTRERLALDFVALVDSLGWPVRIAKGPAKLNGIEVGTRYRVTMSAPSNPFRMPRKRDRWRPPTRHLVRRPDHIEPVGTIDCACIEVESPQGLYQAGRRHVVTHNSTLTAACLALAICLRLRPFMLWLSDIEDQVADKVAGVGTLLQAPRLKLAFPQATARWVDPATGMPVDWRRGRIRTGNGCTLDAAGMDKALRGRLVLLDRPGIIVGDDYEDVTDTPYMRAKRLKQLTASILPMGSPDVAVLMVENLMHSDSLQAQLVDGRADWLNNRRVSGPWPQIKNMETEIETGPDRRSRITIVGGTPTWPEGRGLAVSEDQINRIGLASFKSEHQHEATGVEGHYFARSAWQYASANELPPLGLIMCRGWDLAASAGRGDYTVGMLLGIEPGGDVWFMDFVRGQWASDEVEDQMAAATEDDAQRWGRRIRTVAIEQEPGSAGKTRVEQLRRLLAPHPVTVVPPQGDKEYRAAGLSAVQLRGGCHLAYGPNWGEVIDEMALFPFGNHDDTIDGSSLAYNVLARAARKSKGSLASAAHRQIG